jgi:translocation protein SEC63
VPLPTPKLATGGTCLLTKYLIDSLAGQMSALKGGAPPPRKKKVVEEEESDDESGTEEEEDDTSATNTDTEPES